MIVGWFRDLICPLVLHHRLAGDGGYVLGLVALAFTQE